MLKVQFPLPRGRREPNDEDEWFLESLAEIINKVLYKTVGGSVVGYGGSYDPEGITEVSLTLDDDDTDKMASVLWDTLKRYCPKGTYLEKYARESLDDEKVLLFEVGEDPASEPLPVADRKFAYKPVKIEPRGSKCNFEAIDSSIFRTISKSSAIEYKSLLDAFSGEGRMFSILTEVIDRALNRLRESGYIYSDGDKYFVEESINELLPRTASGKISFHRTKAWKQVCNVLFNENK